MPSPVVGFTQATVDIGTPFIFSVSSNLNGTPVSPQPALSFTTTDNNYAAPVPSLDTPGEYSYGSDVTAPVTIGVTITDTTGAADPITINVTFQTPPPPAKPVLVATAVSGFVSAS